MAPNIVGGKSNLDTPVVEVSYAQVSGTPGLVVKISQVSRIPGFGRDVRNSPSQEWQYVKLLKGETLTSHLQILQIQTECLLRQRLNQGKGPSLWKRGKCFIKKEDFPDRRRENV